MKIRELIKVQRIVVLFVLAALALFALPGNTLTTGAARQQGRGRVTTRQTEVRPAEIQPTELDAESRAALAEIQNAPNAAAGPFDTRVLRFEVAENGLKFVPDATPSFPDGVPAYGNKFITEGYIYTAGTLNGSNGVKPDGSPEFPERVIGHWVCRGVHVGEGGHTTKGPWVITHQLFDFGPQAGDSTITTDGYETPEQKPILRAVTGGTGAYAQVRGEEMQTFLGFNQTQGVSLRFEFRVTTK